MKRDILILFLLGLFFIRSGYSQNDIKFERATTDMGLSEGFVNSIIKDHEGFIWLGTRDGLNRYDGYSFKIFKNDPKNPGSISNNVAQVIYETKDSTLLVGTHGGLNIYNYKTGDFSVYKHDPNDPNSLCNNAVYALYEDKYGIIWIGTFGGGVSAFDRKKKVFTNYKNEPNNSYSLSGNAIRAIVEDDDGNLWIGVDGAGLNKFDRNKKSFIHFRNIPGDPTTLASDIVLCSTKDKAGFFWVGSWASGISKFDPRTGKAVAFLRNNPLNDNTIASDENFQVIESSKGDYWICTRNGLDNYDPKTGIITHNQHDPLVETSLNFNVLSNMYEDRDGILWVCTEGAGAAKLDLYKKPFEHYQNNYKNSNSISNNDVTCIYQDIEGIYWIGTRNGLNRLDMETGQITRIFNIPGASNTIIGNQIQTITQDDNGNLWLATSDKGLSRYNLKTGVFTNFTQNDKVPHPLSNSSVYGLISDRHGNIWISTYGGGINKLAPNSIDFKVYTIDPNNNMQNVGLCLYEDSDGDIWAGTVGHGAVKYDKITDKLVFFENNPNANSISNNLINDIFETKGFIWFCTGGTGFDRYNKTTGEFKNYNKSHGLPADQVMSMLADDEGNIWISTSKGLSKFNIEKETFRNYDVFDGLQSNNFNVSSSFINSKGEMFFGGKRGFTKFHPKNIKDNSIKPTVILTDFKIFNTSVIPSPDEPLKEQITKAKLIEIPYNKNNFSFEFAALHFSSPQKNKYKYMMEGYDKDWLSTDHTRRFATYTNLPAGKYTFHVIASNCDGVWNEEGATIEIIIVPPFWQTTWFYILIFLGLVGIIYSFIKYRENKSRIEREHLKKEIELAVSEVEKQKLEIIEQNNELHRQQELEEKRKWTNEGLAQFADIISNNKNDIKQLSRAFLTKLISYTGAIQGGIFILNDEDQQSQYLELLYSFAYSSDRLDMNRIEIGEGLVGNCFIERKMKKLTNIPDNYITLNSGLGQTKPKILYIFPLLFDEIIVGVLELSFFEDIEDYRRSFIEKVNATMSSQLFTTNISQKTSKLLEISQNQAKEFRVQHDSAQQQIDSLTQKLSFSEQINKESVSRIELVDSMLIEIHFNEKGKVLMTNKLFNQVFHIEESQVKKLSMKDIIGDFDLSLLLTNTSHEYTLSLHNTSKNCIGKIQTSVTDNKQYVFFGYVV